MKSSNLRKSSLALAVVTAIFAAGAAGAAAPVLSTGAHATFMRPGDAVTGTVPESTKIHIGLSLQMRDRTGLDTFINQMRSSKGAIKPLTTAQFMAQHAPTAYQAQAAVNYLTRMGFTNIVVSGNRMLVTADGTASKVSTAFATTMAGVNTHDGRVAYGNTTEAKIPTELQGNVIGVLGLQTVNVGHTFAKVLQPKKSGSGIHTLAVTGHLPSDFRSIYGDSSAPSASSLKVGIFTSGSMTTTDSDLSKFLSGNGYPSITPTLVNTGGTGTSTSGVDEWDLDSQDIVAMTGGTVGGIIWYQTPSLSDTDMDDNFNTIASANAVKVINVSIGGCETSAKGATQTASDQAFAQAVSQGQTFSISTGDSGADECSDGGTTPSWPANSEYVVAAAGTTLNASTGSGATWSSETEWVDSGGSPSKFEPKPSWQTPCTASFRCVADVAFDADPNSGAQLYLSGKSPSTSTQVGGTSLASPLFVGTWLNVLATKGTSIGFADPIIYELPAAAFHDITSGSNGGETAKAGFDDASGWGSLIYSAVIANWPGGGSTGGTPTASFTDTTSALTATFTDTSTDSGGTIGSHAWNFGDSSTSTATSPSHTYAAAGTYSVTETVTDSTSGKTSTATNSVTVSSGSTGGTPTANFTDTVSGLTASFTNTSTDSGGTIGTYAWNFGDSSTSSSASPSHTYAAAGTYTVTLTVTDSADGKTSTKTASVTVASSGGGSTQLLSDTGFENATAAPWTMSSGVLCTNSTCSGEVAHAGSGFAWLDGYGTTHTDTVSQTVTIPTGKTTATIQYYLHIDTAETTKTTAYDTLTVGLYSGSTLVTTLATYSNLNKASGYTVHSNTASVSAYAGKSLTLKFTGKEDSSLQTSFVLDDVTLTAQ